MNSLLSSWNFDTITGSNAGGEFIVLDVSNAHIGYGNQFDANTSLFIQKEDLITFRKVLPETLESYDTIQVVEDDTDKIDRLHKPSSVQLLLENSMYQVISDEMLNMFSTIDAYTFKFSEPYNKYETEYDKLLESRNEFFSKILERPNLEKYLEFYKWIDSSLGYMINQLIPENSRNVTGLKNTVESHVLERSKYKHQLPLTIEHSRNFSSGITVVKSAKGSSTDNSSNINKTSRDPDLVYATASLDVGSIDNIVNKNYKKNYELVHTAGKKLNNRGSKQNKTIFQTRFSSVDGESDIDRDETNEYSVYNNVNQRATNTRKEFNLSESQATPYASQRIVNSIEYGKQGDIGTSSFRDNNFVQRNIPYTDSNYYHTESVNYQNIPSDEVMFRKYGNLLVDSSSYTYEDSVEIVEPPIQFCVPVKQNLNINAGFMDMVVYSPYSSMIDYFSQRNLIKHNNLLQKSITYGIFLVDEQNTFYQETIKNSKYFNFIRLEKLEVVYPRTDLIGLAQVRTKSPSYEEEEGSAQTASLNTLDLYYFNPGKINLWSDNSYNNNASRIRSFWKDDQEDRKRTRGIDNNGSLSGTGSINVYGFANLKETQFNSDFSYHELNASSSIHSMDCNVDYEFNYFTLVGTYVEDGIPYLSCSNEIYGELAPYSHYNNFYLTHVFNIGDTVKTLPKPSFIFNNFISLGTDFDSGSAGYTGVTKYIINKSYQQPLDCRLKPWYNNYEDFRANIKHKSQDRSIVPEFMVSRYEDIIKKQFVELYDQSVIEGQDGIPESINIPKYLTINGGERYDQIRQEDFKVDLKNFVDKKSNKIKFKLNAIKKLLPYNGFYPQQRTAQIAGIFSDEYLVKNNYISEESKLNIDHIGDNSTGTSSLNNVAITRTLAMTQPLFMPGILFNTIKAGVAMPWRTYIVQYESTPGFAEDHTNAPWDKYERREQQNDVSQSYPYQYSVKDLNHNFPFETILDPLYYYTKANDKQTLESDNGGIFFDMTTGSASLPYLDPTHHSFKVSQNNGRSIAPIKHVRKANINYFLEANIGNNGTLYKSAINNFTAETVNFFIKDSSLSFISTKEIDEINVTEGVVYSMDIVLEKNTNFSMFNQYPDVSSTERTTYVPPGSLFGPPVYDGLENFVDHTSESCYYPYSPPYFFNNRSILTLYYEADSTKTITLRDLVQNMQTKYYGSDSSDRQINYRTNLKDCLRYDNVSGSSWIIQTKFETPVFNFNLCSKTESGSIEYIGIM